LYSFVVSLFATIVPQIINETLDHPGWQQAMIDEVHYLDGSLLLKLDLVMKLINLKLDWWPNDKYKFINLNTH